MTTLGRAISEASKLSVPAFAEQHLLAPLGITTMQWVTYDNGRQIVSEEWIAQSTRPHTRVLGAGGEYGYPWWISTVQHGNRQLPVHYAVGNGGQYIFVIPDLDLVAVFTGQNFDMETDASTFSILTHYIVGAVK